MKLIFSPSEACELVGISYRQIQYWDRSKFIRPSHRRKCRYRMYSFRDLVLLKAAVLLRAYGWSIQGLRTVIPDLTALLVLANEPLDRLTMMFKGDQMFVFEGKVFTFNADAVPWVVFKVSVLKDLVDEMFPDHDSTSQAFPL